MSSRALVVDLAVHYEELSLVRKWPPFGYAAFSAWYVFGRRLFQLAIDAGCAVEHAAERPTDAIAALARTVGDSSYFLDELYGGLNNGLSHIGHELGFYFYGGQPWNELCVYRSGVEFIYELCARPIDGEVEEIMAKYGEDMWKPLEIPVGIPCRHWWWFANAPSAT